MPEVPTYGSPKIAEAQPFAPRFSPDAPLEAFGGGAGQQQVSRSIQGFNDEAAKIGADEFQKANQLAVLDADRKASELETNLLYAPSKLANGQPNPAQGALSIQGKDALGLPDKVMGSFKKGISDIAQGLSNDDQRLSFSRMASTRQVDIDRQIQRHVSQQIKQYDDATTDAYLSNERDSATLNYLDPSRIELSVQRQTAAIVDHAQRNGLPAEWVKMKVQDAESKTNVGVVNRMLANDLDIAAKDYYEKNKEGFTGADAAAVEKSVEEGNLRGVSQRQADDIIRGDGTTKVTRADALATARTMVDDPKVRDQVENRLNKYFDEQKQAEHEARNDIYLKATNAVDANPGEDVRRVVSPAAWSQLDLSQRTALENRAADPPNDDKAWMDFLEGFPQKVSTLSRADFETQYWSNFDKAHRSRAEAMWQSAREGKAAGMDPKLTSTLDFKDRINTTLRTSGLIPPDKQRSQFNANEALMYAQFEQAAAQRVEQYELADLGGKRKATGDEVQKIIDGMVVKKVFVDKAWSRDPEKPAATLNADEQQRAYVPIDKIPKSDRNSIENLIRSSSKKVTTSKVQRAYAAYLIGDKARFTAILGE